MTKGKTKANKNDPANKRSSTAKTPWYSGVFYTQAAGVWMIRLPKLEVIVP